MKWSFLFVLIVFSCKVDFVDDYHNIKFVFNQDNVYLKTYHNDSSFIEKYDYEASVNLMQGEYLFVATVDKNDNGVYDSGDLYWHSKKIYMDCNKLVTHFDWRIKYD